ncbi:MAG: retention module-containing protein [Methylophaga sp.]|nr:retention module-containing protein [Methylophaga sp.]
MATEIGFVKALIGSATATAIDGSQRNLLVGDRINADEIITTGDASAIEIEFSDGSLIDLGRNSQAFLDTDVFDPQQSSTPDSDVDITALQDALVDGEDPTQQGDATAAGAESEGNEGVTTVVVEHEDLTVEVTSGFETSAAASSFLDDSDLFSGIEDNASNTNALTPIIAPPTTVPISTQSDNDSDVINFDISGNFSGSGLTFSASGLPSNLSINPLTGIISGTLDSSASQSGPYAVIIIATDSVGDSISQSFGWDVANPAPEADNDSASLNEDSIHNGSVALNDNDPDGDSINFSLNTNTSNGALIFNNDGSYTYTPTANFNGTDSFSYTITDADGATDTATVTLTIAPQDDPTITMSDVGNTDEDTILSVNAANGVLSNDTDIDDILSVASFQVDGDVTTYTANSIATIAGVGALTINSDGSYLFTPAADYDGIVPFASYTTNTGETDTLTISITGINDAPVASTNTGTFDEDQLSGPAVPQTGSENLLGGLTDVDDVAGHVIGTVSDDGGSYQTIASNGSTQIKVEFSYEDKNGDPQTIYLPVRVDADGEYHVSQSELLDAIPVGNAATGSFFYQIDDTHAVNNLSAPQEFTITINGENDAPEFNVTSLSNDGDIPVIVKLSGDSYNVGGQDAPRFIVSVDGVALNGGNALTVEELRSYRIDNSLGTEPQQTSWEYITFNVPAGTSSVAIRFVGDAWEGGSDRDGDGYAEDRNLIIDYVNVGGNITGTGDNVTVTGGTTLQAEDPSVSTYMVGASDRSGRETMPWAGTMTFDVTDAVNNATPAHAFQTENFVENTVANSASVSGTVSLLEGVSDIDDVSNVITIGTVNGNAATVGTAFNLDLSYDDGSGPQIITVQVTVAADGSYQLTNTAALNALADGAIASGTFQFQAQDDSNDLSETQTFTINVLGENDGPVIQAESDFNAVEDAVIINGQVTADDIDSDDDSASLTYSIDGITPAGLIFNADGSYSFDPSDAAYQSLAVGQTTTASFSWKATDSHGADSAVDVVMITITGTNDQPIVSDVGTQGITGAIVLNGALTTSVDYWNFTHNGGDLSIDMLTEISGPNGQNGINGVGYNEIDGDNSQTSLDVMIRVFSLNADGSRGAQVGFNDDNNNPGFDGSLYNRDSFLDLNNLPQGDYQLVVGAWNLTSAEVDSGINAVDATTWHFEGPYQITLNGENGAQLKAQGIAFEAVDGDTLFESALPTVVDADLTDTHDYSLVAASETLSQSNPLGAPLAMPTITVNADGSYSVSGNFNSLALGETATITFQYIADDLNGFDGTDGINESSVSAPATVTITIQGTNDAPIAFVDADSTTENAAITIDVLANDTDIDNGDDQAFSLDNVSFNSGVPAVPTATVSIVANQLVFDPGTDFDYLALGESTTVVVNYTMSDDSGAASNSTATIIITGATEAPAITQAVDANTVTGTHDGAVSLKIFIADPSGSIISQHDATVNPNGTWTADFTKPTVGDYTMTAIAYDGPNGTGNASDVSNAINVNVGSTYQNIVDTDSAINIVFDGNASNTISTGSGDDLFVVGRGNDTFNAGAGDDKFIVEGTNKGSNQFNGGAGTDTIQGGAGNDIIGLANFTAGSSIEIIDGGAGINSIQGSTYSNLDFSATTLLNIDEIRDGNGSNTITGNDQDTNYRVGRGNDTFNTGSGDDTFLVANNSGTNQFNGGAGTDTIQAEEGVDSVIRISATNSIEIVDGGLASDFNVFQGSTYSDLDLTSFTEFRDIDEVRDGNGSNTIIGRDDNTTYRVGRGNDTFNAGAGDDTFLVANNSGTNQFNGGAGIDTIQAEEGVDSIIRISSTDSIEIIDGGLASDFNVLQGATYSNLDLTTFSQFRDIDEVRDGNGSNTITGNDQNITYRVGRGNDTFNTGTGDDTFIVEGSNKGSNQFNGGAGADVIQGGTGDDQIGLANFDASNSIELIDGGAGTNVIQGATYANLDFSATTLLNIDEIRDGNGSNTITGNDQDTNYRVGRGNDTFNAGSGDDTFIVEGSNKGSNQFNGGAGNDTIQGGAGNDTIGLSSFNAGNSIEVIDGGAGNNTIQGSTYSNLDFSTTTLLNIDEIRGGNGSNTIIGSQGDDTINAANGHDSITGGSGNDILTGGSGNDLFIWNGADVGVSGSPAHDEVTDFTGNTSNPGASARDVLDLSDLLSDGSYIIEGLAENNTTGPGQHLQLSIKDAATNSVVQTIDLNNVSVNLGDNTADMLNNLLANGGINDGI